MRSASSVRKGGLERAVERDRLGAWGSWLEPSERMTIDDREIRVPSLERSDLEQLERVGISRREAERQLALLAAPPPAPRLLRPCRLGDGIRAVDGELESELAARGRAAAAAGRLSKFVPASGAASRMFEPLAPALEAGGAAAPELVDHLDRFPFAGELRQAMRVAGHDLDGCVRAGDHAPIVRCLLETPGLGFRELPKGLLGFHSYDDGPRTAFEEHLIESVPCVADAGGVCRLHFTVAESYLDAFGSLLERLREPLLERYGARFEVTFSVQSPATDTLAVDLEDRPFRLDDGRLLLRPGGHGALLPNLAGFDGDVVLVKNIDNVLPEPRHQEIAHWKHVLAGYLVRLQASAFELLEGLEAATPSSALVEAGFELLANELGTSPPPELAGAAAEAQRRYLVDRLDRPLRVCGVVRNEGEPGGGPFWVGSEGGRASLQIVERSQIDSGDATQRSIFEAGTHFNPVDLACAPRDRRGRHFDLERFVDPAAVFISSKSQDGRELRALERPGLWNGAMARWNTLFVEVPIATFAPVKTLFDLLRPAHQRSSP